MSDLKPAANPSTSASASKTVENAREKLEKLQEDIVTSVANDGGSISIRSGSALKTLRMTAASSKSQDETSSSFPTPRRVSVEPGVVHEPDNEPVLMLTPTNKKPFQRKAWRSVLNAVALFMTAMWIGVCASYIFTDVGWNTLAAQQPHLLGGFIAGMLAPVALLWVVLAFVQRSSDVQVYAETLRGELQTLLFPSEERSQIIHNDVEILVRQAAELTTASKAVLKSIHRARMGLRNEIQGLSGLSKKSEFHIDRLSETLAERTAKLLTVTAEIEQRTSSIDEKAKAGTAEWDRVTRIVMERSAEMESALTSGAGKLLEAADGAKDKTDEIAQSLEGSYGKLREAIDQIAARLEKLSGDFESHKKDLSSAVDQVGALNKGAENLAAEAETISSRLANGLTSIEDVVSQMDEKAGAFEEKLSARATVLKDITDDIDNKTSRIESLGDETAHKLSEGMAIAVSGAESLASAVRRAVESMARATEDAQSVANDVIEKTAANIERLNDTSAGNADHMQKITDVLEKSRTGIEEAKKLSEAQASLLSQTVEEQLEKINAAQSSLGDRIENVRTALTQPLQDVNRAVADADAKHADMTAMLDRRVADLTGASEKATENAEKIRDMLRTQAQDISVLAGQIAGNSRVLSENMGSQKDSLTKIVTESLRDIASVGTALENQADRVVNITQTSKDDVARLSSAIGTSSAQLGTAVQDAMDDLSMLNDRIVTETQTLTSNSRNAIVSIETLSQTITRTAMDAEPVYTKTLVQAEQAQEKLISLRNDLDVTADRSAHLLSEAGATFDIRLHDLKQGITEAAVLLKTTSEQLIDHAGDIETASLSANEKMRTLESTLQRKAEDIHLAADQAILKTEAVQKAIDDQFHELSGSLGRSIAQIQDAGQEFANQAGQTEKAAESAYQSFEKSGQKILEEGQKLKALGEETVSLGKQLSETVQAEAASLLKTAQENLSELKKTGDSIAFRAKEVSEHLKASLATSKEYGQQLTKQAQSVVEANNNTADAVAKSISVLALKLKDVEKSADAAAIKITSANVTLAEEAKLLSKASDNALKASEDSAHILARQSAAMTKAAEDALKQVDSIRGSEWKAKREAFLSSSGFIVESLHSLSVDLTRSGEGGIQEKNWKQYQSGDLASFTRRLVESDRMPVEKVRDKYAHDSEFRNYVGRFLRQFEEIHNQALGNDHGDLLAATFMSSDVGRLYQMLCTSTGREPRKPKDTGRKAA